MIRQSELVIMEVSNSHDATTPGPTILTCTMPRIFPTPLHLCMMDLLSGKDPIIDDFFLADPRPAIETMSVTQA